MMGQRELRSTVTTRYTFRLVRQLSAYELAAVRDIHRNVQAAHTVQSVGKAPKLRVHISGNDPNGEICTCITQQLERWHARHA